MNTHSMIGAIVPAAGLSRRMGATKQLLPFAGTTVIGHIVDQILLSKVDEVCVVVGHQADLVTKAIAGRRVHWICNPDYQRSDMLASIRCGLAALSADCRAILIALGDQPSITAALIDALIEAMYGDHSTAGRGIIVPKHGERRGHPILIDARYRDEIASNYDQLGLRGLLAAHSGNVFELPMPTSAVLYDINYPDDYKRELARQMDHDRPSGREC